MSAEWVQNGFLNHFRPGYLRVESVEGGDATPDGRTPLEGMQDMLVWSRIQKLQWLIAHKGGTCSHYCYSDAKLPNNDDDAT